MADAHEGLPSWREALGEQIREAREKARLTQEALAKAIGLKNRNMIGRYEAGTAAPTVNILGSIAMQLAMPEVKINGYRFSVLPTDSEVVDSTGEQLRLDFDKEHVFSGATLTITPTKLTITIKASAPMPAPSATSSSAGPLLRRSG